MKTFKIVKHQREAMAAHWSNDTVTLFTAVVYYRGGEGDLEHNSRTGTIWLTFFFMSKTLKPKQDGVFMKLIP